MIILGIAFLADASACIVKDGQLLAAISEERLNRVKLWYGVPHLAIKKVLEIVGITMDDVDLIATHGKASSEPDIAAFDRKRTQINKSALSDAMRKIQLQALDDRYTRESRVFRDRTPAYLEEIQKYGKPVITYPHHTAHAASAYYGSGWGKCVVLTIDGWGEDASSTLWECADGEMERVSFSNTFDSLGYFYGSVTKSLGFTPHRHEGKVLGLAAYGDLDSECSSVINDMVCYDAENRCFEGLMQNGIYKPSYNNPELDEVVHSYSRENISAAVQTRLENIVCELVKDIKNDGLKVAVAGGIFANVKLNQRIRELDHVDSVYVFPNMGDGGLSVGSAWLAYREKTAKSPQPMRTALLGNDLGEQEIVTALEQSGLHYERFENITKQVGRLLARGDVVVRAQGRMEFGPRALGNRSIMYKCGDPAVNNWLNTRLDRSEFMPFAPATLSEQANKFYVGLDGSEEAASYMTMTCDCTDKMVSDSPAAVHVDRTARPQLINSHNYPDFYKIMMEYQKLTGLSSLINTSFNMHEEPIVCSAEDSIRAFKASTLPWLALGHYLVSWGRESDYA